MEDGFIEFAHYYDEIQNKVIYRQNERISAFNPVIFLFIGSRIKKSLECFRDLINSKWENSKSFIHMYISDEDMEEVDNFFCFKIKKVESSKEEVRKAVYDEFVGDKVQLELLNNKIIEVKNRILERSREFSFCERVSISVITRLDDPLNALVIPLTALFKTKLGEYFNIVSSDLFDILEINNKNRDMGYDSAITMSYFNEIEYCRDKSFHYRENLDVQAGGACYPVEADGSNLFDLVFILSDRDELGFYVDNSEENNCKIVSYVSLIKNRDRSSETYDASMSTFDANHFISAITFDPRKQPYASAGLSEIKRPNKAISLIAMHTFYKDMLLKLRGLSQIDNEVIMVLLGMDKRSLESKVEDELAKGAGLDDMYTIMYASDNPLEIAFRGLPYRAFEDQLYGEGCREYFMNNFQARGKTLLNYGEIKNEIENIVYNKIIDNVQYGLYSALQITSREGLIAELEITAREIEADAEGIRSRLDRFYNSPIRMSIIGRIFKKRALKKIRNILFGKIYRQKLEVLKRELQVGLIHIYCSILGEMNASIKHMTTELEGLSNRMRHAVEQETSGSNDYACENVEAYYEIVVKDLEKEFSDSHGANFFFHQSFFGNVSELLKGGIEEIEKRLITLCRDNILNKHQFDEPFEAEIQHRANTSRLAENSEVLSKKDLFDKLNGILEKGAKAHIHLVGYGENSRHEEKYFFGKGDSEFIQYAYKNFNRALGEYKMGHIEISSKSGIEKLNLLGGFTLGNIFDYGSCKRYYDYYIEKGFKPSSIIKFSSKEE